LNANRQILIYEGPPTGRSINGERWIRLLVRKEPRSEDVEAEQLLRHFAEALRGSDFEDEFVLSIFRIEPDKEPTFGYLPKIESVRGCEGIEKVRRYLSMYSEDVKVPLVT
jgi:hypothetical protein